MHFNLSNFLFGKNPASAAQPYLQKNEHLYDEYAGYGKQAGSDMAGRYGQMANDPTAYYNQLMEGYQPSASYEMRNQEAQRAAGNSAAAGGMRGSQQDVENSAKIQDMLMGEDMQQWLKNVMGIESEGSQGQSHMFDTGFNATNQQSNNNLNQAGMAFQGQAQNNANRSQFLSGLAKYLGAM